VEAKGLPTPRRVRRQRRILGRLSARYRPLLPCAGGVSTSRLRPAASFGFSKRTPREEAVAKLVAYLDDVDPEWRSYLKVWDGGPRALDDAVRA
jgi:hypothetical protein